ncbi:response regulator [Sporosarcina sp. ACRSM]|uniref:response regulator n=1 Tax=Sporosarcina sp. ACRSM TaxID=2918216 RepID=UPI001EF47EC2|nr:response regulator [Sporosarcina sp. ACRSM]MCG7336601.1 response regulator [Sporosarcina sp. ACRSM]
MIRAILVDDEPLALQHMEKIVTALGSVQVIKTFSNTQAVLDEMPHLDFHVVFLDIDMPGINGLDLAEIIQSWNKDVYIVFVTAYRDYAIEAFELDSIDYLMKPVMKTRLEKTISRIQEQLQLNAILSGTAPQYPSPALKINCFDEFAVYYHETPVKWKTAKVKELFAFFISNLNTYLNRDMIIDMLWTGIDYAKAKIQLHTAISHLRKTLEANGSPGTLTFSNQSYILKLHNFQCDAIELERALDEYDVVNRMNIQQFEQLVQQYSGDYMEKNGYEWATIKAQNLRQKLLQLLQNMVDFYHENEDSVKKQHYLQLLLHYNPYSEQVLQQLMQQHILAGNRGDAVKLYHDFKKLLLEDLGILPSRATNELYESILYAHES